MKKLLVIAGLTALSTIASSAQADDRFPYWYVGLTGGYTYMADQDVSGGGVSKISPKDGFGVGGAIGYLPTSSMPLLNNLRFEAEVTYHENEVGTIHLNGGGSRGGNGNYSSTAYMFNTYYDFQTGSAWTPYIGGGIGAATLRLSNNSNIGNRDDSDDEFAYQAMAGIGYAPEALPNTQWTLGYRYLGTSDAKFSGTTVDYSTHSVELGAKFRF